MFVIQIPRVEFISRSGIIRVSQQKKKKKNVKSQTPDLLLLRMNKKNIVYDRIRFEGGRMILEISPYQHQIRSRQQFELHADFVLLCCIIYFVIDRGVLISGRFIKKNFFLFFIHFRKKKKIPGVP